MAATLPGTLPTANYQPTYRSNGACDDLAALVAPYSLSRAQLAEATGIADEATVNSWVEQCCPGLAADVPVPLEPVLRYLDETYLPDPANWPVTNAYDEFVLENIAARMLASVQLDDKQRTIIMQWFMYGGGVLGLGLLLGWLYSIKLILPG